MSLLNKITTGIVVQPVFLIVNGPPGTGKTTLASKAKSPIFIGAEDTSTVNVSRFPLVKHWYQVNEYLTTLINETHEYKTVVIDTLDSLEPLLHRQICKDSGAKSLELAYGGYGKGFTRAAEIFCEVKNKLEVLRYTKGMNIIILGHVQSTDFNDPMLGISYRKYEMKMHKKAYPIFNEAADAVLFIDFEMFKTEDNKPVGVGNRVMYTESRPGFYAKNRFSLPPKIDLNWGVLCNHIMEFYKKSKGESA